MLLPWLMVGMIAMPLLRQNSKKLRPVIQLVSLEQAHEWYNADDYAELKALRLAATGSNAVFIEGM